ncbi:MAG: hypothetical protein AABX39_06195 [Nanoarchaeota archaeon]
MPNEPISKEELQRRIKLDEDFRAGKLEDWAYEYQKHHTLSGSQYREV